MHAIDWPAFLMAAELSLPRHIFAHGALSPAQEGKDKKFLSEPIVRTLGCDAVRYYLLSKAGYGEDTQVSREELVNLYNADLADGLERLAGRILELVARHCNGKIPVRSLLSSIDPTIEIVTGDIRAEVRFLLDSFDFSEAIKKVSSLSASVENVLKDSTRDKVANDSSEKHRIADALHDACEGLGRIALLLHPIVPRATEAIWKSLGQTTRLEDQLIVESPWVCVLPGTRIKKLEPLFPEVDHLQRVSSV